MDGGLPESFLSHVDAKFMKHEGTLRSERRNGKAITSRSSLLAMLFLVSSLESQRCPTFDCEVFLPDRNVGNNPGVEFQVDDASQQLFEMIAGFWGISLKQPCERPPGAVWKPFADFLDSLAFPLGSPQTFFLHVPICMRNRTQSKHQVFWCPNLGMVCRL